MKITADQLADVLQRLPHPASFRGDHITLHVQDYVAVVSGPMVTSGITECCQLMFVLERSRRLDAGEEKEWVLDL